MDDVSVTFERLNGIETESPTLVEGFPGHGLVAAIAVDQITRQLSLEHYGNLVSGEFPPVLSYQDGRARDTVRVYAGSDPSVMTLQSDIPLPPSAFEPLSRCVHEELAAEFDRAVFLVGRPARSEEAVGTVRAIATTDDLESELLDAGIELADGTGVVGGITGALANGCYHDDIPAAVLVVDANPYLPDPGAAQSVIEEALEPLVEFDVDTSELEQQANRIKRQMQQIAEQYQQMVQQGQQQQPEPAHLGMYQ